MKFSAPESADTGGGNWLDKPGTYHLVITATEEQPKGRDGTLLDGFQASFQAVEGTVRDNTGFTEKDKTIDLTFWNPKLTSKDEGAFALKKQTRFLLAAGLMTEGQLGQADLDIDLAKAVGRQVIATFEENENSKGKKFLDLSYADIFHVDDPEAAKFPRNEDALKLAPADQRRDPKSFKKKRGNNESKPKPKDNDNAGSVDLNDL